MATYEWSMALEALDAYIEKYEDFKEWISNFCRDFDKYRPDIEKIISTKFQIIKAA